MSSVTSKSNYAFVALFMLLLLDTMGFGLIFPVLSPLLLTPQGSMLPTTTPLEMRELLYGVVMGSFALCMFISGPLLGDLSDQIGRKRVLLLCLVGSALGALLCAISIELKSIVLLLLGRILSGLSAGSQALAQAAIIDISTPSNKTKNLGLISFASSIGFIIGPVFGGYLADSNIVSWFNYATPFFATTLLALLNAVMLQIAFQETFTPAKKVKFQLNKTFLVFSKAISHPKVRLLALVFLFSELAWAVYFQYVPLYFVAQFKLSAAKIGLFMSFIGIIFGLSTALITRIFVRFLSARHITLIGLIIFMMRCE